MKYPLTKFSNLPIIIGTKMITWILHLTDKKTINING
jgi:hypothetical protein